jgi:hypothetical protein
MVGMMEHQTKQPPQDTPKMSKRYPLMAESHLKEMDNDVWNRAAPGHTGSPGMRD